MINPLVVDMVNWCSHPPAQLAGDGQAILCSLVSAQPDPRDTTQYRGFLFFRPGSYLPLIGSLSGFYGTFYGTLALTRSVQRALGWARIKILVEFNGDLWVEAKFYHTYDDLEPYAPGTDQPPPGFVSDFKKVRVVKVFNSSGDHFIMTLDNGWLLAYALRTLTP